ncbi:D-arabinono-1,4-lactone oxidase [Solirubrobacter soli]|uniref:D-arabinono-1,4-lactone oxidase n=1 Tax=Solirubrobacter soli TaxID=363832 RepID=UPI0003F7476A|nr:D-arabinono-1,4-lactone oxidase [Solirubrobacter soli]
MKLWLQRRHRSYGTLEHPASEGALVGLVGSALRRKVKLRVRGAAHSGSRAIYANHSEDHPNRILEQLPPPGEDISVQLDGYRGLRLDPARDHVVIADAGIHLGEDPSEGGATLERSLLHRLYQEHHWTLADVGGITHQTVSGFMATASAGGSIKHSFEDTLAGVRIIDGGGRILDIKKGDPHFGAMFGNLGLLGVVSQVTFNCIPTFDISGTEVVTTIENCEIDLFGERGGLSLEEFLKRTDFARIEWWPQRKAERVVVWQARMLDTPLADSEINPYRRFGRKPMLQQLALCFVLTLLGNTTNLRKARWKLKAVYAELREMDIVIGILFAAVAKLSLAVFRLIERWTKAPLPRLIPYVFPGLLNKFCPLDKPRRGRGAARPFTDRAWHGLPMDNELSDVFIPTAFTELFVPLSEATKLMRELRTYFSGDDDKHVAYRRTGLFAFEAYAAKASDSWLSPAYTTRADDCPWRDGAFRFNAYWFALNDGAPERGIFKELWEHLRDKTDIKFRLHWGKFQPIYAGADGEKWREFFKDQYPRWDDFLALREQLDPHDTFLTSYWEDRMGVHSKSGHTSDG